MKNRCANKIFLFSFLALIVVSIMVCSCIVPTVPPPSPPPLPPPPLPSSTTLSPQLTMVALAPYDRESLSRWERSISSASEIPLPFNMHGIYMSKLLHVNKGEVIPIILKSDCYISWGDAGKPPPNSIYAEIGVVTETAEQIGSSKWLDKPIYEPADKQWIHTFQFCPKETGYFQLCLQNNDTQSSHYCWVSTNFMNRATILPTKPAVPNYQVAINEFFVSRWGHPYYNNHVRVRYDQAQWDDLRYRLHKAIDWCKYTELEDCDCSEMSAYLEYFLERHGYTADIAGGDAGGFFGWHAWVLTYDGVNSCWVPMESDLCAVRSSTPVDYLNPHDRYETIYEACSKGRFDEWDWWTTLGADLFEKAAREVQ